ncbi:ABC transporter ATP-binding protein [Lederbergia citrea]|uniref:ABC transporter ATP-binding protein n=1 Tax=Lederbergia citrea TaxID=2833581 RepID=A0A942UJV1_9BACI|nr:dipeptide/oligopeptide/nickel ABC transporter ATP-binding protein [Lederbergia citrea]MBS4176747.1 ABC transporter ATP-binding protein [Lederbergia citrea]MBS4203308.1 ABC transporter ATP-binding protein [Lederbergia citrea]MBS4222020.1 ABC transporter ATP-binding protein [Lederbergia citrea]
MLLKVDNVHKSYRHTSSWLTSNHQSQHVLKNITFEIADKEIVGLVGESGSGKSTLARILMQLERADSGCLFFMKKEIELTKKLADKKFYQNCQIVFQNHLSALNPSWKVLNILLEPLLNLNLFEKKAHLDQISYMLNKFHLNNDLLERYPHQLSGGERQRVNLLRSILLQPKLLICDEVVSNLDVIVQKDIIDLLKKINQEMNMAILFISHDLHAVQYFCDRLLVMKNGEIIDQQARNDDNSFSFSHPYSQKLFSSIMIADPANRQKK